ncbi:hypothetical protein PMIN07_009436 [Paraphaeosphaeria minitans]
MGRHFVNIGQPGISERQSYRLTMVSAVILTSIWRRSGELLYTTTYTARVLDKLPFRSYHRDAGLAQRFAEITGYQYIARHWLKTLPVSLMWRVLPKSTEFQWETSDQVMDIRRCVRAKLQQNWEFSTPSSGWKPSWKSAQQTGE